ATDAASSSPAGASSSSRRRYSAKTKIAEARRSGSTGPMRCGSGMAATWFISERFAIDRARRQGARRLPSRRPVRPRDRTVGVAQGGRPALADHAEILVVLGDPPAQLDLERIAPADQEIDRQADCEIAAQGRIH